MHKTEGDCYIDTSHNHFWVFPKDTPFNAIDSTQFTCCCGCINYVTTLDFESVILDIGFSGCDAKRPCFVEEKTHNHNNVRIVDSVYSKRETIASAFELSNAILRVGVSIDSKHDP